MQGTLDMQVAALIFLSGTKYLITSEFSGDVETMNENNEETDEENPYPYNFITVTPILTKDLIYDKSPNNNLKIGHFKSNRMLGII